MATSSIWNVLDEVGRYDTYAIEADGSRTYEEYISPHRRRLMERADQKAAERREAEAAKPKARVKRPLRPFEKWDSVLLHEMAMDRVYGREIMPRRDFPNLADNECEHGWLPGDPGLDCHCFAERSDEMLERLKDAIVVAQSQDRARSLAEEVGAGQDARLVSSTVGLLGQSMDRLVVVDDHGITDEMWKAMAPYPRVLVMQPRR